MAAGKRTREGMLARGLDSGLADRLISEQITLEKLKTKTLSELLELGIPSEQAKALRSEGRPPIPSETVIKLLHDSRSQCAVCRDPLKAIIIHHIEEWADSHSHAESNLVVLCLDHHGEAHTKRELSLNLTPDRLRALKKEWIARVRELDADVLEANVQYNPCAVWDYFNTERLPEVAGQLGIPIATLPHYRELAMRRVLDKHGALIWAEANAPESQTERYLFDIDRSIGQPLLRFYSALIRRVLRGGLSVDLTDRWSRSEVRALVNPGQVISTFGSFYFRDVDSKRKSGKGQIRRCRRKANGVAFECTIDAWEARSQSAWGGHLTGHSTLTLVALVRGIEADEKGVLRITASVLATGSGLDLRYRSTPAVALRRESDLDDSEDLQFQPDPVADVPDADVAPDRAV